MNDSYVVVRVKHVEWGSPPPPEIVAGPVSYDEARKIQHSLMPHEPIMGPMAAHYEVRKAKITYE